MEGLTEEGGELFFRLLLGAESEGDQRLQEA